MVKGIRKQLDKLEKYLSDHVYANFAQLPEGVIKPITRYLALISLILALLCLLSAYDLWQSAHNINSLITFANNYGGMYGVPKVPINHHMGLAFWLGLGLLLFESYLFIKASSLASKRPKAGWEFIYYALITNVAFGIVMLFSYFGGIGTLFERTLFSFVCLYVLFEIKEPFVPSLPERKTLKKKK